MSALTDAQAEALAALIRSRRRDHPNSWDMPGIGAAIEKARKTGIDGDQIIVRACHVMANRNLRTPELIGRPGAVVDVEPPPLPPNTIDRRCAEHPTETAAGCPICIPKTATARPWREVFADPREASS